MKKRQLLQILNLKTDIFFSQINQTEYKLTILRLSYNTRTLMPSLSSRLFVYVCVAVHNMKKNKRHLRGLMSQAFFPINM